MILYERLMHAETLSILQGERGIRTWTSSGRVDRSVVYAEPRHKGFIALSEVQGPNGSSV